MSNPNQCPSVFLSVFLSVSLSVFSFSVYAEEKQWSGAGDGISWEDALNWNPASVPVSSDDPVIDAQGANTTASKTFSARTLKVGGRKESNFTTYDFIYGTIAPAKETETALYIRKDGLVTLKGPGDITLKGSFKNSEESLPDEPGFMFAAE